VRVAEFAVCAFGLAAFLAGGCASSDLSGDRDITREVIECLPTDTTAPSLVARAIWYPGASGFGSADESALGHVSGVIALADDKLWFMEWNAPEGHFDILHVITVAQAGAVKVARLGNSAMLVVESGNQSFDSFELMNAGQFGTDPKATQALCARLEAIRARDSQPGP
jgi:hypothetical protein